MARTCKVSNKSAELLREKLAGLKLSLVNDSITNDEFINQVNLLKLSSTGKVTDTEFELLLNEVDILSDNNEEYEKPALVIKSLDYDNLSVIFKNSSSAFGHVMSFFKRNVFKYTIIDNTDYGNQLDSRGRKLNDTVNRIPLTPAQLNQNVAEFKNKLISIITDGLDIDGVKKIFNQSSKKVDYTTYVDLMTGDKVSNFILSLSGTLQFSDSATLDIFSAIFILNNFDRLMKKELAGIFDSDSSLFGQVTNTKYFKNLGFNLPSIWSADSLESYGAELYTSNLGKIILNIIPKVNSSLRVIEGSYMLPQDSFVISALLKEAEYEYHLLGNKLENYNENLSMRHDARTAIKTLLTLGINDNIPILSKYKKEIFPIYNFLYGNKNGTIAVSDIITSSLKSGKVINYGDILNVEEFLTGELAKNIAPVYLEYNLDLDSKVLRTIYAAHTFRGTSYFTDRLIHNIADLYRIDAKDRDYILRDKVGLRSLINVQYTDILSGNSYLAKEFLKTFNYLFGVPFNQELLDMMAGSQETSKNKVVEVLTNISDLLNQTAEGNISIFVRNAFNQKFPRSGATITNYLTNVILAVADVSASTPITQIRNSQGKAIPIYRLNSQIFEDTFLINKYKIGRVNRGSLNFFINNLHTLTKYNSRENLIHINPSYQGSTGLRLETILGEHSNPATDSSAAELWMNAFFGDFLQLGLDEGHLISVLLMTYSDKASIFTKIINLDSLILGYGNISFRLPKSLDQMTNKELYDISYFFRKNQMVDRLYGVLEDWNKLLNLNLQLPDINAELINSGDLLYDTYDAIEKNWKLVKEAVESLNKDGFEKNLETILRNNGGKITKELHYRKYGKKFSLNKSLYAEFLEFKDKNSYRKLMEDRLATVIQTKNQEFELQINLRDDLRKMFELYMNNHNLEHSSDVLERWLILDNFIRSLIMDLGFKGTFLDDAKMKIDYDETVELSENLLKELSKNFKAAGKRTVDEGGTKQNFQQGLLGGVSEHIKIAHINEPKEPVFNPDGDESSLKIFDGSARSSFIYYLQELASLGRSFNGNLSLKTLWSDIQDSYSTLYKWAEFAIDNWQMRMSMKSKYKLLDLHRKMHNVVFTEDVDLTKSLLNPKYHYTPTMANNGKNVYFSTGIHYYQLIDLLKLELPNTYNIVILEVDKYGNSFNDLLIPSYLQTNNVKIDSIYKLFDVLGGIESMSIGEDGTLRYSNDSLFMLYNYVTNIGEIIEEGTLSLNTVRLPLRDMFTAIAASNSAIKRGETNTNNESVYENSSDLLTTDAFTNLSGLLVDYGHSIEDHSDVTEPTQTLAALATNGTNVEEAQLVYNAIAEIIKHNFLNATKVRHLKSAGLTDKLLQELSREISKNCEELGTDILNSIVQLCESYLGGLVPISDSNFYTAFHTWNIMELNRLALRRKHPGMGGILNPSSNIILLFTFGDKTVSYEDLMYLAKDLFSGYEEVFNDFTTDELVNIIIASNSDEQSGYIKELLSKYDSIDKQLLIDVFKNISDWVNFSASLPEGAIDQELVIISEIIANIGKRVQKGQVEALDTIYYKKLGVWYKALMDTYKKMTDFQLDNTIEDVYIDISTPHDLKPLVITVEYNDSVHNLFDTDAARFNNFISSHDKDFKSFLLSLESDGVATQNACKLL